VDRLSRRAFLASAAAGAGGLMLPRSLAAQGARSPLPLIRGGRFAQGVMSGQPSLNGATLWTRLEGVERTSRLQVEISRDPDFGAVLYRQDVVADVERGFAVHHRAEHPVLRPGEEYFYRFFTCDENSRVGRFRTLRPADSREPVRVAVFSCQKYHQGFYTAHRALAAEPDLDLVVCLGDYIYEERNREQPIPERQDKLGANGDGEIQTLEEFRAKYALYQGDADLQAMHAAHAFGAIWDDHEVENDYAGTTEGDVVQRRIPFEQRKSNGYRAWRESLPLLAPAGAERVIYGRVPLGANADVFLLDERQYRDPLLCEPVQPCPQATAEPPRTLLGREQKDWLKGELERSRATWKLMMNQVMIMALDLPTGVPINADQWDGYAAERRELLEHVLAKDVQNVSWLTGDIHTFFAGTVTTSGRSGAPAAATEFVAGSITSEGIAEEFGNQALVSDRIREPNPHITFVDTEHRGYAVVEARQDELRVDFRFPETVKTPTSPVRTLAAFKVAAGSTEVERA
jgi:phosphodiesterase/alkaline phosphatase D-like protein